jgi:membrane-associated phospholipid phosphatase
VISAQSHSLAMLLNATTKFLLGRERPYSESCDGDTNYHESCEGFERYRSFYSSHSSMAATSAGLTCAHHVNVPLYGSRPTDVAACAGAALLAASVGTLRIAADEHWATDVFAGQLIGFSIGYFVPTLFYYRGRGDTQTTERGASVNMPQRYWIAPSPRSIRFGALF